jgi:hypothetical protein
MRGRDFDSRTRQRSPQEREFVDRQYKDFQNFWKGNKGDGRDNRDWSGRWRDSDRFNTADRIRRDWRHRDRNNLVFGGDWWRTRHSGRYWNFWGDYAYRHNRPWYWWSWATAPRLASWFVFGWPTPYYWDYGPGEYIYVDNGAVYVNGRWYEPAPAYYEQTVQLIDQAPLTAESAARLDWMPLGVFAVTPDGMDEADVIVQLAVTNNGLIGGTAFDQRVDAAYNIEGAVDKKTQRAAWSYTNDRNNRVVMETSIYNLTQPEATGLVHYGPTDMRMAQLVRLQEPDAQTSSSPTLPLPPSNQ